MDRVTVYWRKRQLLHGVFKIQIEIEDDAANWCEGHISIQTDRHVTVSATSMKEIILLSFCKPDGILSVVLATMGFGMGLDCPNVCRIIHWGPSADTEQFWQVTGSTGRDGLPSVAILYATDLHIPMENPIKGYF